jgi:hypothetical protein
VKVSSGRRRCDHYSVDQSLIPSPPSSGGGSSEVRGMGGWTSIESQPPFHFFLWHALVFQALLRRHGNFQGLEESRTRMLRLRAGGAPAALLWRMQ